MSFLQVTQRLASGFESTLLIFFVTLLFALPLGLLVSLDPPQNLSLLHGL